MYMFDLNKCSKIELENMKKIIVDVDLLNMIDDELYNREKKIYSLNQYSSDRLPDYREEYNVLCNQILLEYNVFDFEFLSFDGFFGVRNNKFGDFSQPICGFTDTVFDKKWRCNLGYLALIFNSENLKINYEGSYNTLNYIINFLYKEIYNCDGNISCINDLFSDIFLRKEAVQDNFTKIVDELWEIRNNILGSRLSIGNQGLSKNRYKFGKRISRSQKMLIDALAYGCSLKELNEGNYEGAKRLVYVPRDKINIIKK